MPTSQELQKCYTVSLTCQQYIDVTKILNGLTLKYFEVHYIPIKSGIYLPKHLSGLVGGLGFAIVPSPPMLPDLSLILIESKLRL
jgi:hypothetical protein